MNFRRDASRAIIVVAATAAFACTESPGPSEPGARDLGTRSERSQVAQDRLAALFPDASRDVMALPGTVFADHDEAAGKLVFGVENEHAIPGVQQSLEARGISADDYVIRQTEPIRRLATLREAFRPTRAGTQIHFGGYVCTLGFNVDHAGGTSFITNSHCTNTQGGTEGTQYGQASLSQGVVAVEAADPNYVAGGSCSAGKVCRSSDASRALYNGTAASARGVIAKTTGLNTGSLTTATTSFSITAQDDANTSFSGTVNKVGRTTGWTAGNITNTCATVNVSGSNVQLRCQTLVTNSSATIVSGGDSGSPVFKITSGDNVTLIGILWGGSGTSTFVFSPLKSIQDELGAVTATIGTGGEEPPPPPPPGCVPIGKSGKCR